MANKGFPGGCSLPPMLQQEILSLASNKYRTCFHCYHPEASKFAGNLQDKTRPYWKDCKWLNGGKGKGMKKAFGIIQ